MKDRASWRHLFTQMASSGAGKRTQSCTWRREKNSSLVHLVHLIRIFMKLTQLRCSGTLSNVISLASVKGNLWRSELHSRGNEYNVTFNESESYLPANCSLYVSFCIHYYRLILILILSSLVQVKSVSRHHLRPFSPSRISETDISFIHPRRKQLFTWCEQDEH